MYNTIFEDFAVIKSRCTEKGKDFDAHSVFSLLEELHNEHRENLTDVVLQMLGIESKPLVVKQEATELTTIQSSNDDTDGSVVEVEIPKKVHPIIDLTDNSVGSSEDDQIMEMKDETHSHDSNSNHSTNPSLSSNGLEDNIEEFSDWDQEVINNIFNEENPIDNILERTEPIIKELQKLNPNSRYPADSHTLNSLNANEEPSRPLDPVIDVLEENNNDPNNNFGNNPEENRNNDLQDRDILMGNETNVSNNNRVLSPKPSCSTNIDSQIRGSVNLIPSKPASPIPGCSKNSDNGQDSNVASKEVDDSMRQDAICIQEIIPWATLDQIFSSLKRHSHSVTRKEQTLWDLMSEKKTSDDTDKESSKRSNSDLFQKNKRMKLENVDKRHTNVDFTEPFTNADEIIPLDFFDDWGADLTAKKPNIRDTVKPPCPSSNNQASADPVMINYLNPNRFPNNMEIIDIDAPTMISTTKLVEKSSDIAEARPKSSETYREPKNKRMDRKLELNPPPKPYIYDDPLIFPPMDLENPFTMPQQAPANPVLRPAQFSYTSREKEAGNYVHNHKNAPSTITKPEQMAPNRVLNNFTTYRQATYTAPATSKHQKLPLLPPFSVAQNKILENPSGIRVKNGLIHPNSLIPHDAKPIIAPPHLKIPSHAITPTKEPSSKNTSTTKTAEKIEPDATVSSSSHDSSKIKLDRDIYYKLRSMFSDVDSNYIKKICKRPPVAVNVNNKEQLLNLLIDHLLNEGSNNLALYPTEDRQEPKSNNLSIDEQCNYLQEIFKDADPTYLREFVEKNHHRENALEEFIQQKLEKRDYPTRDQYLSNIKKTEQMKDYTVNFKVEKFLEIFPDPVAHFEDPSRKCQYEPIAFEFFKSFFSRIKVNTITQQYTKKHYNISLTAKSLTALGSDMKSKRVFTEMPTESIPLLQEIAFVKHREVIVKYLKEKKDEEERLYKELEASKLLLECQCCFDDKCMPSKVSECGKGHIFCNDCVIKGVDMKLAEAEVTISCFTDCQSEFSLQVLQKALPPTKFSKLLIKKQAAEVLAAEVEGLVSCPFCHFASIPPPEDKVFKCLNPECMKESCRLCKDLSHVPLKCHEVIKTDKARLLIEEKMTQALLRTCYKCKTQFYKEEGCNKMTCVKCHSIMCYLCDKPVKGYDHFNGQGSANNNLCPLWSDDKYLNAIVVRKAAEDAQKEILKQNPNLKIDTKALLPEVPKQTRGPHNDIPNANQIPAHYRHITGGYRR